MKSYKHVPKKICFHLRTNLGLFLTKFFEEPQYTKRRKAIRFEKNNQNQIDDYNKTELDRTDDKTENGINCTKPENVNKESLTIENEREKGYKKTASQIDDQNLPENKDVQNDNDALNNQEDIFSFLDENFNFSDSKYSEDDIDMFELEKIF